MAYTPTASSKAGNSAAAAAKAAAQKAAALKRAHQDALNKQTMEHFAIAIAAVIGLFTVFHWTRFLYSRYASKSVKQASVMKAQVAVARKVRNVLIQRIPGFTSIGHAVLVMLYVLINLLSLFVNMELASDSLIPFAKRVGWVAISNIAFVTFLALKNTPLAFLTAYSYDKLNCLHQVAGYTTVTLGLLHGICISIGFIKAHYTASLLQRTHVFGITAVVALFTMMLFALLVRKMRYEVFYVSHIAMYIIIVVMVGLHQPHLAEKAVIGTIVAGSIWASDRVLRGFRVLWYSHNNHAIITPLPHGGTRIVLSRSPSRAVPGTHCFLWLPQIRLLETHPFTIVNTSPTSLELVISAYDGFTKDLHNYALKNPDSVLRASIDGPYGYIPSFAKTADRVILIAGGSGASFTFGLALDMIRKLGNNSELTIDFVWTVREQEALTWFSKELALLRASPRVNITLHSTRLSHIATFTSPASLKSKNSLDTSPTSPTSPVDIEKQLASLSYNNTSSPTDTTRHADSFPADVEKTPITSNSASSSPWDLTTSVTAAAVHPGRPDIASLITEIVAKASDEERIAIAACGPDELMRCVRKTAANCIRAKGPSIELHCEQFGW